MHVDHLVIFSRSAKSFQIILNKLESFCENANLSVPYFFTYKPSDFFSFRPKILGDFSRRTGFGL